jgi:hypothetical protein
MARTGPQGLSNEELDAYVLARLKAVGVDLSVLPEDDPEAPVDRRRVLAGARRFLRTTPSVILALELDPQEVTPSLYPAGLRASTSGDGADG